MATPKVVTIKQEAFPHNGDGRPELQFPDPVTGEMIGGQVAFIRMAMRFPSVVAPWARRQGKTRGREFLIPNEAAITSGTYYGGICFPDHTTAFKVFDVFRQSWGGLVESSKGDAESQDRWIKLKGIALPKEMQAPKWFTPRLLRRFEQAKKEPNTGSKIYFWSVMPPHYQNVQGFPHPFHRIDWDEFQQIDRRAPGVIRPMLRDVQGHETFTGTPWDDGPGNIFFEELWDLAGLPDTERTWFRMRIPDGTNPHVPRTNLREALRSSSENELRQSLFAEFIQGSGQVFSNVGDVCCLPHLPQDAPECAWVHALLLKVPLPTLRWWIFKGARAPGHIYALSVDWARSPKGDYTVLSVFDMTTAQQVAVFRWRGEDFNEQMEWVLAVQKQYGAAQCHSDAQGIGRSMSDFMVRRKAVGFQGHKFHSSNKIDYVRRGQILFREKAVSLLRVEEQHMEFKQYRSEESETLGSTAIKFGHPIGKHDDFVDSFLMVAPTLTIVGRQSEEPEEEAPKPVFDGAGMTTIDALFPDGRRPWFREDANDEPGGLVLGPRFRAFGP